MDNELLKIINDKTNIVDLVSEFVQLQKRGKNYFGLCPFHDEKTPSFSVSPEKNICKCMGCGEGGQPITFYSKIKGISITDAALELAERAGIEIKDQRTKKDPHVNDYALMKEAMTFYRYNLTNSEGGQQAFTYLHDRGLSDQTIDHFNIGYAPSYGDTLYQILKGKGFAVSDMIKLGLVKQNDQGDYFDLFAQRIMFPVTDLRGHVVGFSGRTLVKTDKVKYLNSPETAIFKKSELIYHLYEGLGDIRKAKQVILHEGFFDVIASYQAGVRNVVATMGTALTSQHARILKQVTPYVILAYDGDSAGQKAIKQAIPILSGVALKQGVLVIPEGMDPDEFVQSYGPQKYEALYVDSLLDPYQFLYQSYKKGKTLSNANDMKSFKDDVIHMLETADATVQGFYRKKLAADLHVDEKDIVIKKTQTKQKQTFEKERTLPPKKPVKILLNKYENAERYLLCGMLRSKKNSFYIQSRLGLSDYIHHMVAMLRIKVEDYYKDHDILEIDDFLNSLMSEQRDFMIEEILEAIYWKNIYDYEEEGLDEHIDILKSYTDKKRIEELRLLLIEKPLDPTLLAEYQQLQAKLKP